MKSVFVFLGYLYRFLGWSLISSAGLVKCSYLTAVKVYILGFDHLACYCFVKAAELINVYSQALF